MGVACKFPSADYENNAAASAAKIFASVNDTARRMGVTCKTFHVKDRYAAEGIVETAKVNGCDLIIMASHGRRGFRRLVLGSVANEVVTTSIVPVLVVR